MAELLVDQVGRVRVLTLQRPEVHNAISLSLAGALMAEVTSAEADPGTRVLVIRGSGRAFSAGYDLSGLAGGNGDGGSNVTGAGGAGVAADARRLRRLTGHWERLWSSRLPVIAQVHGYCLAGGTDLALHCDVVVVADDARIGYPPVRSLGVPPSQMWLYHVGPQWTKRLLLTGDTITGRLAAEIGFALTSVAPEALEASVMTLAERMATVGREMLKANKSVVNHGVELMGRSRLQEVAVLRDAIAHTAPEALEFQDLAATMGLRAASRQRDQPFAAGEPLDLP